MSFVHKEQLLAVGHFIMKEINSGVSTLDALKAASAKIKDISGDESEAGRMVAVLLPGIGVSWALSAFASISISHKLAASLMMTSIPIEYHRDIYPPWNCFAIDIPHGLITGASFMICYQMGNRWQVTVFGDAVGLSFSADLFHELFSNPFCAKPAKTASEESQRALERDSSVVIKNEILLKRLFAGVCIEMARCYPSGVRHGEGTVIKEKRGLPKPYTYRLSREVKLDVRPLVEDYLSGDTSRHLRVQSLVRGHSKYQPCGAGSTLRKWIHVEPYWRGPEDAPIAVRAHVL